MYKEKILVLGGTTEGRLLCEFFENKGIVADVSVASDYGKELLGPFDNLNILMGRMDLALMREVMSKKQYTLVVDTTHPFAIMVTQNIKQVCEELDIEYVRVVREKVDENGLCLVSSFEEAVIELNKTKGKILLTTGSKELIKFQGVENLVDRLYVRTLPTIDALEKCEELGVKSAHVICMQGPFTKELNVATLEQYGCTIMVTKASGTIGGMMEKMEAARSCGVTLIVIDRPILEDGISLEQIKKRWKKED